MLKPNPNLNPNPNWKAKLTLAYSKMARQKDMKVRAKGVRKVGMTIIEFITLTLTLTLTLILTLTLLKPN